jgi:hypothetical protein
MQREPAWEDVRRELREIVDLEPSARTDRLAALSPALRIEVESLLPAHYDSSTERDEPRSPSSNRRSIRRSLSSIKLANRC